MTRALPWLAVLLLAVPAQAADPPHLTFINVTVIDVATGKAVPDQVVWVRNRQIARVGTFRDVGISADSGIVDGRGKYLIPGLWDMHTHIADETYLALFLANGVTGVREMHAFFPQMVLGMRDDVAAGKKVGPRIVAAGALVDGPQPVWPGSLKATTPDEGREAVRKLKGMKADFVKVYSSLTPEVYRAIVDEAKKQDLPVVGHCPERVSVVEACDAGQRSVEHLMGVPLACAKDEEALRKELAAGQDGKEKLDFIALNRVWQKAADGYDPDKAKGVFGKFVKNGTWHCPTTVVFRGVGKLDPDVEKDDRLKYMPPIVLGMWKGKALPGFGDAVRKQYDGRLKLVRDMVKAGVPMLAGTDCTNPYTYPGFSLPRELELFVECGMTPAEALRTATLNPAKFFDEEKTAGTIEAGKRADLVLLDDNPLDKVGNVRKIAGVMANGRYLSADDLKKMLGEVEAKFAAPK